MDIIPASLSSHHQNGSCCCYVMLSKIPEDEKTHKKNQKPKTDGNDRDDRGNHQPAEIKTRHKGGWLQLDGKSRIDPVGQHEKQPCRTEKA